MISASQGFCENSETIHVKHSTKLRAWAIVSAQSMEALNVIIFAKGRSRPGDLSAVVRVMGLDLLLRVLQVAVERMTCTGQDWCRLVIYTAVKIRSLVLLANSYYKNFRMKYKIQSNLQRKLQNMKQNQIRQTIQSL